MNHRIESGAALAGVASAPAPIETLSGLICMRGENVRVLLVCGGGQSGLRSPYHLRVVTRSPNNASYQHAVINCTLFVVVPLNWRQNSWFI